MCLRPEVLAVLGFSPDADAEKVKERIENFDSIPILHMETEAGHVTTGLNFEEADYPQAFSCLVPRGSTTEIDLLLADIPKGDGGNIRLSVYGNPFTETSTHDVSLYRSEVVEAMKSIDDFREEGNAGPEKKTDAAYDANRVFHEMMLLLKAGKTNMRNIPMVIRDSHRMGLGTLCDFASEYPLRYLRLWRKNFQEKAKREGR